MSKTLEAVFDGEVLRPEDKEGLQPNARYRVVVEMIERPAAQDGEEYPLTALAGIAADMGVADLSARHDHYAHGKLDGHERPTE
jgi:hypothetical protein